MLKKLVVGTVLAGCLLSCGKYADLEKKLEPTAATIPKLSSPGSADLATELEGTWKTVCAANGSSYYNRESRYQGSAFFLSIVNYSDSKCAIKTSQTDYFGTFQILGPSKVEGAKEIDFKYLGTYSGTNNYTIFRIDAEGLRFGGGAFASSAATRSTSIDTGPALKKIQGL